MKMKKIGKYIIGGMVLMLTGCSSSSLPMTMDNFSFPLRHHGVVYQSIDMPTQDGIVFLSALQEKVEEDNFTGYLGSYIGIKMPVESGSEIASLVEENIKELQLRLIAYTQKEKKERKFSCKKQEYPGYSLVFSYQLGQQTIYGGQYYFSAHGYLYVVSISSDNEKSIKKFIKGTKKMHCI